MHTFRITRRDGRGAQRHPVPHRTAAPGSTASRASTSSGRSSPASSARRSSRSSSPAVGNVQLDYLGRAGRRPARRDPAPRLGARAEKAAAASPMPPASRARRPSAAGAAGRPRREAAPQHRSPSGGHRRRVDEFLAPELDPTLAPPESVVHLPLGRVFASTLLGGSTSGRSSSSAIIAVGVSSRPALGAVLASCPPRSASSATWSRITKSLRYSIAGTPDGVRVGYGLLSTSNETIPPGRIHASRRRSGSSGARSAGGTCASTCAGSRSARRTGGAAHDRPAGRHASPTCIGARAPAARLPRPPSTRSSTRPHRARRRRRYSARRARAAWLATVLLAAHRLRAAAEASC